MLYFFFEQQEDEIIFGFVAFLKTRKIFGLKLKVFLNIYGA